MVETEAETIGDTLCDVATEVLLDTVTTRGAI